MEVVEMFGETENRGMFFVRSDPASTTPKMFLSFGDKQARKERG